MAAEERIAKVIARAGVCSRRDAEKLIEDGKVYLNGQCVTKCATFVVPEDEIQVNGKTVSREKVTPRIYVYHKPKGVMTTHFDPQGRPTVFEKVKRIGERVISVGRLDFNTEGLLLLTNYGPLARYLEHPNTGLKRVYKVRVFGETSNAKLDELRKPFMIDGIRYQPFKIDILDGRWLRITIYEGKNREIRKAMEKIGLEVSRLIRTSYGPYDLGHLPEGKWEEVKVHEEFLTHL